MSEVKAVSSKTRNNWILDASLALSAIVVFLTSIYFLFLPLDGYRGGRNPYYGINVLFDRHTWSDLHNWVGLAMIVIALVHLAIHYNWVFSMTRKVFRDLFGRKKLLNARGRFNVFVDAMIGLGFLAAAVSGVVYFFLIGENPVIRLSGDFLFAKNTWDMIHTWGSILMIAAAVVHFAIHWQWVVKVTRRVFQRQARLVSSPAVVSIQPEVRS